jgi:outer membrane protein TolC
MHDNRNEGLYLSKTTDKRKPLAGALAALLLAMVLLPATGVAQTDSPGFTVGTSQVDLTWNASPQVIDGKLELTMWEAIEIALRRNYTLVIERYNLEEAGFRLTENMGIYDFGVTVDLTGFSETNPAASNLDGAPLVEREGTNLNLGISQLNRMGGTFEVDMLNNRSESNSTFSTLNPSFRVDLDLSYRQPLLRDLGKIATARSLIIATNNLGVSREAFEQQVIEVVRIVGQNYWTLIEAIQQLLVAEESLRLAEELHSQNKIRVEVGTMAPLELVQSEAGMATRRDEHIRAQIGVGNAEDDLREALNIPDGQLWDVEIIPQTPPDITRIEIDIPQAVQSAFANRPEVRRKRLENKNLQVDSEYFRNQRKPRLDLTTKYGWNGLGGDVTERNFFTGEILFQAPGAYKDAIEQVFDRDFVGWNWALNLSIPIQNRAGKARNTIAQVAVARGNAELEQLKLQVSTEVRKAARTVITAEALVDSTRVSRRLEEANTAAEQKRYENGMSTSFQVLQIQEDLATARSNAVKAETGYRKALIEFYRAIGTLDDVVGVQLQDG